MSESGAELVQKLSPTAPLQVVGRQHPFKAAQGFLRRVRNPLAVVRAYVFLLNSLFTSQKGANISSASYGLRLGAGHREPCVGFGDGPWVRNPIGLP